MTVHVDPNVRYQTVSGFVAAITDSSANVLYANPATARVFNRTPEEALGRNVPLVLYNHPDGEHGFDNQGTDTRSREIVREAVEFLRRNLAAH